MPNWVEMRHGGKLAGRVSSDGRLLEVKIGKKKVVFDLKREASKGNGGDQDERKRKATAGN